MGIRSGLTKSTEHPSAKDQRAASRLQVRNLEIAAGCRLPLCCANLIQILTRFLRVLHYTHCGNFEGT